MKFRVQFSGSQRELINGLMSVILPLKLLVFIYVDISHVLCHIEAFWTIYLVDKI